MALSGDWIDFTNEPIRYGDIASVGGSSEFFFVAVAKYDDFGGDNALAGEFGGGDNGPWLVSEDGSPNQVVFIVHTDQGGRVDLKAGEPDQGKWHIYRCAYDGSEMSIHIDGVEAGTASQSGNLITDDRRFFVAGYDHTTSGVLRPLDGGIAEMIIATSVPPDTDIAALESELESKWPHLLDA